MKRAPWFRVAIGGLLLAGAVAFASTRVSFLQGDARDSDGPRGPAPEFTGIARWLNSEPLTMSALRGKVVWIDFWTYSCINCVRTLPAVRAIYARYRPFGLEVVGVHAPEFDFEKSVSNVRDAIARYDIPYPVALDNDMATWRAYENQYWPRVYLVDARGRIRYDRIGEGGDRALQDQVRALLAEAGARVPPAVNLDTELPSADITPEIYAGSQRSTSGSLSFTGRWTSSAEYAEAAEDGARVVVPFRARKVFMVAAPDEGSASVRVLLDGKIHRVVDVGREDLFGLVTLGNVESHSLAIIAPRGLRVYSITFG